MFVVLFLSVFVASYHCLYIALFKDLQDYKAEDTEKQQWEEAHVVILYSFLHYTPA
jgi:hypothetical protein